MTAVRYSGQCLLSKIDEETLDFLEALEMIPSFMSAFYRWANELFGAIIFGHTLDTLA